MKTFKKGDQVKTIYGEIREVLWQEGCRVYVYGGDESGSWYHPSKVWKMEKESNLVER